MKHTLLVAAIAVCLLPLATPQLAAQSETVSLYGPVAYNDTNSTGFHGPIEIDFSQADSIDLEFHFQGPFKGNVTLAPHSDLVPAGARQDSVIVLGYDSTVFAWGDTLISRQYWELNKLVGGTGLSGKWDLYVNPLAGVTWAEKFEVVGVLSRKD